MKNIEMDKN